LAERTEATGAWVPADSLSAGTHSGVPRPHLRARAVPLCQFIPRGRRVGPAKGDTDPTQLCRDQRDRSQKLARPFPVTWSQVEDQLPRPADFGPDLQPSQSSLANTLTSHAAVVKSLTGYPLNRYPGLGIKRVSLRARSTRSAACPKPPTEESTCSAIARSAGSHACGSAR
jgi:hypothetical protein